MKMIHRRVKCLKRIDLRKKILDTLTSAQYFSTIFWLVSISLFQTRTKVMNGLVVEYLIDRYEDKWKEPTVKTGATRPKTQSFSSVFVLKQVNTEVSGFRYTLAFIWCPDICPWTLSDLSSEQFRRAILEKTCELRGTDNVNLKKDFHRIGTFSVTSCTY